MDSPQPPGPDALPPPPPRWLTSRAATSAPIAEAPGDADLAQMQQQLMLLQSQPPARRKLLVLDANGLLFWRVRKGQAPRGSPDYLSKLR